METRVNEASIRRSRRWFQSALFLGLLAAALVGAIFFSLFEYGSGTNALISEVPEVGQYVANLKTEGGVTYVYKHIPRHIACLICGKAKDEDVLKFANEFGLELRGDGPADETRLISELCTEVNPDFKVLFPAKFNDLDSDYFGGLPDEGPRYRGSILLRHRRADGAFLIHFFISYGDRG
jgi:hypothetical protein